MIFITIVKCIMNELYYVVNLKKKKNIIYEFYFYFFISMNNDKLI